MRYRKLIVIACLVLAGCASLDESSHNAEYPTEPNARPLVSMYKITIGMGRQEAEALLKKELLIGYNIEGSPEKLDPITIAQPYREESFSKNGITYQVLYYYTSINRPDDLVADDELTPLVFENNILIGKGLADLDRIKRM